MTLASSRSRPTKLVDRAGRLCLGSGLRASGESMGGPLAGEPSTPAIGTMLTRR